MRVELGGRVAGQVAEDIAEASAVVEACVRRELGLAALPPAGGCHVHGLLGVDCGTRVLAAALDSQVPRSTCWRMRSNSTCARSTLQRSSCWCRSRSGSAGRSPVCRTFRGWARRVSNLRPLACEASALPLSYAPQGNGDCKGAGPPAAAAVSSARVAEVKGRARRSAARPLERRRPNWTHRRPFNPVLLPLEVYIAPTNSGMDVPGGVKDSGGGDRGSICWG